MEFDYSNEGKVIITMEKYINKLMQFYGINQSSSSPTTNSLFEDVNSTLLQEDKQEFLHSGVAKLLYLSTRVRPDISLPVNYLCSRVNKFSKDDEDKFYKILYYLNQSRSEGIIMNKNDDNPNINVYADASYGINKDRKSQTGIIVKIGQSTIISKSVKQNIVTKSSTEAELVAASESVSIAHSLKSLMDELQIKSNGIKIHQDNQSTIRLINNNRPISQRTKHIDIRYFFLRDRIENKDIEIIYTPSNEMISDLLTKPLPVPQFNKLKKILMNGN